MQESQSQTAMSQAEIRHHESVRKYPHINLSEHEYVVLDARRHPIGIISIWIIVGMVLALTFVVLPIYAANRDNLVESFGALAPVLVSPAVAAIPLFIASALFVLGGILATKVYNGNKFYLTNESIIQRVQKSIFNVKDQTIGLVNVEDVSYDKRGILQHLLNYGDLRLSTQGEETIYHFYTVGNPEQLAREVTNATERAMHEMENPSGTEG